MLITLSVAVLFIFGLCLKYTKSVAYAWFASCYWFVYYLDGIVTQQRGALYFSPSITKVKVSDVYDEVALYSFISFALASMIFSFLFRKIGKVRDFNKNIAIDVNVRLFALLAAPILLSLWVLVSNGGVFALEMLLSNRQLVFNDNIFATIALYLLPICAFISFATLEQTRSVLKRTTLIILGIVLIVMSMLTGSRSAFLLNAMLPITMYFLIKYHRHAKGSQIKKIMIYVFGGAIFIAAILLSNYFRDITRGVQNEENILVSPDFSQFDSTALIMHENLRGGSTYLSALTFLIPRTYWNEKPISGNRYFSEQLFSERLDITGAETTSSLLGEAFINYGWMGTITAGLLLAIIILLAHKYMRYRNAMIIFGLVVLFRGTNIIRGDLLNTVVPLFFAYIWIRLALSKTK